MTSRQAVRAAFVLAALLVSIPSIAGAEPASYSEPSRWAVGVALGEPTGLSVKRYLGGRNAFDLNLDPLYGPGLRLGVDYLWGLAQLLSDRSSLNLDVYVGLGGLVGSFRGPCVAFDSWRHDCNGDVYVGGRVPLGIEAVLRQAPLTFGLEVAPGLAFAPGGAGFLFDVNLIIRVLL